MGVVLVQWLMRIGALALAVVGGLVMFESPVRSEQTGLDVGAPYLLAGFLLWLLSELVAADFRPSPRARRVAPETTREAMPDTHA